MLVDTRYPLLAQNADGSVLAMLHSVLKTIEVKTRATSGDLEKAARNAHAMHALGSQITLSEENDEPKFQIYTELFCYRIRTKLSTFLAKYMVYGFPVKDDPFDAFVLRLQESDCPPDAVVGATLHYEPLVDDEEKVEFGADWMPTYLFQYNPLSDLFYRTTQDAYYTLADRNFSFLDIGQHLMEYMSWSTYRGDQAKREREGAEHALLRDTPSEQSSHQ